jgi:regulator of cell morphogenesis and NO signaling
MLQNQCRVQARGGQGLSVPWRGAANLAPNLVGLPKTYMANLSAAARPWPPRHRWVFGPPVCVLPKSRIFAQSVASAMEFRTKNLHQLVEENYVFGAILHFFGIDFYKHPHETLEKVCARRHLSTQVVTRELQARQQQERVPPQSLLASYPVDMVIGYLRQSHRQFTRRRLPYLASLVQGAQPEALPSEHAAVLADLQLAFPLFAEDFIRHIHKEENEVFGHITLLDDALYGLVPLPQAFFALDKVSIQDFAQAHHADDDDMAGIRELTQNYATTASTPLIVKVLYAELQAFEEELKVHAAIEDELLLVKAQQLEHKVRQLVQEKARLN